MLSAIRRETEAEKRATAVYTAAFDAARSAGLDWQDAHLVAAKAEAGAK